jgi:hypothetical protein
MRWCIIIGLLALSGCGLCGRFSEDPPQAREHKLKLGPRPGEDQYARAGNPQDVAVWAQPSDTGHYDLYPVGGGAARHGGPPGPDEGTWGWDYLGLKLPSLVDLGWYHDRYQGGGGSYETEGPHLLRKIEDRHD